MRRYDPRLIVGILLVIGGLLALLDAMEIISNGWGIFGGLIFGAGGLVFLSILLSDRNNWWAAFPAFTLLGLSASSLLSGSLEDFTGLAFFLGISLGFWWVYFSNTENWWAIIPAGVLLTLGIVSLMGNNSEMDTGGLFLIGLGFTFILVAVLPGGRSRSWALIPGTILVILGALLGTPFGGIRNYLLPVVLIVLGVFFVFRFIFTRSTD